MIVDPHGNALSTGTPCATCKGVPERWRTCVVCAHARYDAAVIYEGTSPADALAAFERWRLMVGLTPEQAPAPAGPALAPHATRRASTNPAGDPHVIDSRGPRGDCRGCGEDYPLVRGGLVQAHRFGATSVRCLGSLLPPVDPSDPYADQPVR